MSRESDLDAKILVEHLAAFVSIVWEYATRLVLRQLG